MRITSFSSTSQPFPPGAGKDASVRAVRPLSGSEPSDAAVNSPFQSQGRPSGKMAAGPPPAAALGAGACSCGSCPRCAAKAYAEQAGLLVREGQGPGGESGQAKGKEVSGKEEAAGEPGQAASPAKGADGQPLSEQEQLELARLARIDAQVKAHEQAHLSVAGPHARGGASFQYAEGPDGRRYAVAGEVSIDTSREATPEATIGKMRTVRAAALAPADPSPQDRKVAVTASMAISEASHELRLQRQEESRSAAGEGKGSAEAESEASPESALPASGPPSPASGDLRPSVSRLQVIA